MHNDKLTSIYTYLDSEQTAYDYLLHCYKEIEGIDAEAKSYENCHTFMYYLQHGQGFFQAGKSSELQLQPILFFYGITHLLKAVLLSKRPNYPESTKILAHGVSTRKKKKKYYRFVEDEVKIQNNGLFPYTAKHLYSITTMPFEKVSMQRLFGFIPELLSLFSLYNEAPLQMVGKVKSNFLSFPVSLLDTYHLTERAFLKRLSPYLPTVTNQSTSHKTIDLTLTTPLKNDHGPFFFHSNSSIYFPAKREAFISIPEMLVHYLLLYNLSMINRYETAWWGDLLTTKPTIDFPLIRMFLNVTMNKVPQLIGSRLLESLK